MTLAITHSTSAGGVVDATADVDGAAWDAAHTLTGVVSPSQGGTGVVNNDSSTITISGSFGATFTLTATTGVTFPTTGTLATLAGAETHTNKTLDAATLATRLVKGVYIIGASAVQVSHTGDTAEFTLATIAVPANAMGANGIVRVTTQWSYTGSAGTHTVRGKFNGTTYMQEAAGTTAVSGRKQFQFANRNATNSQVAQSIDQGNWNATTLSATVTSAHDTTGALNIVLTGQNANAADTVTLESYLVELIVP